MPGLDPAAVVLSSPMLATRFSVRRRAVVVGTNGRGSHEDTVFPNKTGVVSPVGGRNGQERREEGAIGMTSYTVVTRFPLRKQANGIFPDVVLYRGLELLVVDVQDCLDFGAGWVVAQCTSDRIADAPIGG